MTIDELENKINNIILPYIDNYNGKQPIYTIIDRRYIKVNKEFLDWLPSNIYSLVNETIKKMIEY